MTSSAAQQTTFRIFQLIRILKSPPYKTVKQLSKLLGVTSRSVYRYLELLEEIGYLVENQPNGGQYFIFEAPAKDKVQFTEEESQLVSQMLASANTSNLLVESIRRKIQLTSEAVPFAEELIDIHRGKIIALLRQAIADKKQVRLIKYHSNSSDLVIDRIVEPNMLDSNYTMLEALELSTSKIKSFRISRIENVAIIDKEIVSTQTGENPNDAFGFAGTPFTIKLNLTKMAHRLLIEEFPIMRPNTKPTNNESYPYQFVGEVNSNVGVGRFILGLPNAIEVISPQSLRDYLNRSIKDKHW